MKRITAAVVVVAAGIMVSFSIPAIAFNTLGMSPDQVQQMIQNNQASDSMMLELIRRADSNNTATKTRILVVCHWEKFAAGV